jgi:hypothetical protein
MPEVEKRIDRMHATQRRASLMARYENRYGEKLDVPSVFVPVEEEKPEAAEPAAPEMPADAVPYAAKPAEAPLQAPNVAVAPVTEKPAAPALPPKEVKLPEAKPAAAATKPAAVAAKPAAAVAKPVPTAAGKPPEAAKPSKPSPISGKSFWKYLWPYWRMPFRALAKHNSPENKGKIMAFTIVDIPVWILLALPRIVLCPIGLAVDILKKRKAKQANGEKAETAVAVN